MPARLFHAAGKVHVSCIVTSEMSFKDGRDVLPIVRSAGNAYCARHICIGILSELQEAILGPPYERDDGNEKRPSISARCSGGIFLGRRGSQALSRGRGHTRRQRSGRLYSDGDNAPTRFHDSSGPPPPLADGSGNHDAHYGKSPSHSPGPSFLGYLDPRFCGRDRRFKSMGLGAHAGRT
jgi:hypothetical protein